MSDVTNAALPALTATKPYTVLRHPDYRRLWLTELVSRIGTEIAYITFDWQIYLLTHSSFWLGIGGLLRAMTFICIGPWVGFVVDNFDRPTHEIAN